MPTVVAIGALLGLLNTALIVYDRMIARRPQFTVATKRSGHGGNLISARLKNNLDEDIIIDTPTAEPRLVVVANGDDERAIADALVGEAETVVIPPRSDHRWPLVIRPEAKGREQEIVVIKSEWRDTRRPWPFRRYVHIKTSVAELNRMKVAERPTGISQPWKGQKCRAIPFSITN